MNVTDRKPVYYYGELQPLAYAKWIYLNRIEIIKYYFDTEGKSYMRLISETGNRQDIYTTWGLVFNIPNKSNNYSLVSLKYGLLNNIKSIVEWERNNA